jgi:hypothetical protein
MSNLDDETLAILSGLNAAQPTTQQVDYSGFMDNFQPVLNQPNYFVPQQGLLQNTPTLDTLSDLDVMQQRPQSLLNMIDQYPTLESDFQRSFAVNPDTFNMNVYQRLPYDPAFWESFVNQGGSTTDDGIDLTGLGAAGLIGAGATSLLGGENGSGTNGGSSTVTGGSGNDDGDGGTTNGGTSVITIGGNTISSTGGSTNGGSTDGGSTTEKITLSGTDTSEDNSTLDGSNNNNLITVSSVIGGTGNDNLEIDNSGSNVVKTSANTNTSLGSLINSVDTTSQATATNDINTLINSNVLSNNATSLLTSLIDNGVPIKTAVGNVIQVTAGNITDTYTSTSNLINPVTLDTDLGLNIGTDIATGADAFKSILGLDGDITGAYDAYGFDATGFSPDFKVVDVVENGIKIGEKVVQKNFFDKQIDKFGNFINNPINEGFGAVGSGLNDATSFTGGEALALGGGLLSAIDAIEDGNVSNVFNAAAGVGASGLLGGAAYNTAMIPATATAAAVPVGGAASGIQGLATNPATAIIGTALFIANQLDAPPSGKTGSGAFDYNTSTNTEFGMAGDKFKQSHVDQASAISQGIGTAINTIADGYGLNVEGDHLVETGRERPLSLSFGDQESEQTSDNRLNYSAETGDITNSTDTMKRFYYTGTDGNDGTALADNVIKGTSLLSLKAIANGEDTINMQDFRLPARSESDVKNQYLLMGLDETAANALTSASQQATPETAGLLGGILYANTSNEDLFLTDTEKTSLLEKGYTEEQLDEILYG